MTFHHEAPTDRALLLSRAGTAFAAITCAAAAVLVLYALSIDRTTFCTDGTTNDAYAGIAFYVTLFAVPLSFVVNGIALAVARGRRLWAGGSLAATAAGAFATFVAVVSTICWS